MSPLERVLIFLCCYLAYFIIGNVLSRLFRRRAERLYYESYGQLPHGYAEANIDIAALFICIFWPISAPYEWSTSLRDRKKPNR